MGPPGPEGLKGEQGPMVILHVKLENQSSQTSLHMYTHRVIQVVMERKEKRGQREQRLVPS